MALLGRAIKGWSVWLVFLFFSAAFFTPVKDSDLQWQLSAGRYIVEHHAVPRADFLSWTKQGQPWIDFEWGAQVIGYGLERAGGITALCAFKAAVFFCVTLLFIALLRLWKLPDSWIAAALAPLAIALVPFADARPEAASYLFCLAELYVLESRRLGTLKVGARAWLALHALGYTLWANLHPGFPLGLMLCLLYGLGEAFEGRYDGLWFWTAGVGVLGTLINPYGPRLYTVFLEHARQLPELRTFIVAWAPPDLADLYNRAFLLMWAFTFAALLQNLRSGIPYAHGLVALAFAVLSSRFYRQVPYFSLIVFPLALRAMREARAPDWWPRWRPYALGCLLVYVGALGFMVLRHEGLFTRINGIPERRLAGAADFLTENKADLKGLHMFCTWDAGSYLGHALYPDYRVFMDGRYLFSEFQPYVRRASADPRTWQAFLRSNGVELVVSDRTHLTVQDPQTGQRGPVDFYYMPRWNWALVYWDESAAVWVSRSAASLEWLGKHEWEHLHPGIDYAR